MRVVVVGLGVQGRKRQRVAAGDVVATVDPAVSDATHRHLSEVDPSIYDAALLCVPDAAKAGLLKHLVACRKHALVEKPLSETLELSLSELQNLARVAGCFIYTAYNHRFEPHLARVRDMLRKGAVGEPYRISIFYGNGTARLVRESGWRDTGSGVLHDLGSHVVDMMLEWCDRPTDDYSAVSGFTFENGAADHVVFQALGYRPALFAELSLLSWRNTFRAEVIGSSGSLHVDGLAKWGESVLVWRRRVLPAGRPDETVWKIPEGDPTWSTEYEHFRNQCSVGATTDLTRDMIIDKALRRVADDLRLDPRGD